MPELWEMHQCLDAAEARINTLEAKNKLLEDHAAKLLAAIRRHRDYRGDDRCWMDDEELYKALPEGYDPPARDSRMELAMCQKFIACRHHPATAYVSPQRRIEELEAQVAALEKKAIEPLPLPAEDMRFPTPGPCAWCGQPIDAHGPPDNYDFGPAGQIQAGRLCPGKGSQFFTPRPLSWHDICTRPWVHCPQCQSTRVFATAHSLACRACGLWWTPKPLEIKS